MDAPPARRIVCFGDSITEGGEFLPAQRWTTLLQQDLDEWQPKAWRVYRRGVGGHTSAQGLARFAKDVQPLLPAIVLVEFGFNDANVYDWTASPRVALADYVAIGAIDGRQGNGQSYNDNFAPYEAALRKLIAQLGAPSIDLPALMREVRADPGRFLAEDGLHLCVEGNRLYAGLVFGALKPLLTGNLQKAI